MQSASLYDNFCKTGNYVIYDVIILVQDGKCKKWIENFSIGVFYNITKNQDNPFKTVGRDSFLSPKTAKNTSFLWVTQPPGVAQPLYSREHNLTQTYNTCPSLIEMGSKTAEKNSAQTNKGTNRQTNRHYENNGHLAVNQYKSLPLSRKRYAVDCIISSLC